MSPAQVGRSPQPRHRAVSSRRAEECRAVTHLWLLAATSLQCAGNGRSQHRLSISARTGLAIEVRSEHIRLRRVHPHTRRGFRPRRCHIRRWAQSEWRDRASARYRRYLRCTRMRDNDRACPLSFNPFSRSAAYHRDYGGAGPWCWRPASCCTFSFRPE